MSGDVYLIRKGGAYYRPNAAGYTYNTDEAGRYTLAEAIRHSHPNGPNGPRDGIDYMLVSPNTRPAVDDGEVGKLLMIAVEDHDTHFGRSNVPAHWTNQARAALSDHAGVDQMKGRT